MAMKIFVFFLLLFSFFLISFGQPRSVSAIALGKKSCGTNDPLNPANCINCVQEVACAEPCQYCDCGANCNVCVPVATTCGTCSASCGGGTKTCTDGCSSWDTACNTQVCCTPTAPTRPISSLPLNNEVFVTTGARQVDFSWQGTTVWGEECSQTGIRRYDLCLSQNLTYSTNACGDAAGTKTAVQNGTNIPPLFLNNKAVGEGTTYWALKSVNKAAVSSIPTTTRNFCYASASDVPVHVAPADGTIYSNPATNNVVIDWNAPVSWGAECAQTGIRRYDLCTSTTDSVNPCTGTVTQFSNGTNTPPSTTNYTAADGRTYWAVRAWNKAGLNSGRSPTWEFCVSRPPKIPVPTAPPEPPAEVTGNSTLLVWDHGGWGSECTAIPPERSFQVCICKEGDATCNTTNPCADTANITYNIPYTTYSLSKTVSKGTYYWTTRAVNRDGANSGRYQPSRKFCVETGPVTTPWSACDANHKRTRTCTEDCGTDDCQGVVTQEDCLGEVRGTFFDASGQSVCPALTTDGYRDTTTIPPIQGVSVSISDNDATHIPPWIHDTPNPMTTNSLGRYTAQVYSTNPTSQYTVSFSGLPGNYEPVPTLVCDTGYTATVTAPPPSCLTQSPLCSGSIATLSFGFTRVFNGWWQAQGGSVHGETGVVSDIPTTVPAADKFLILEDLNGRTGFLSHLGTANFGTGQVSPNFWEKTSGYRGPVYDYAFFHQAFNSYPTTALNPDTMPTAYNDGGRGYEIYRVSGGINNFSFSPTGTQKVIFEVSGNVNVVAPIDVPNGAFLAIIAGGTITYEYNVNSAEGWYIGRNLTFPCKDTDGTPGCDKDDTQFTGTGTFAGWNGISMGRNLGDLNNTTPAEKFIYSLTLYDNAPEPMKSRSKTFKPFIP